jgi:hypothetical protein
MALIVPEGKLVFKGPLADGLVKSFGLGRDWRFAKGTWYSPEMEYIDPLQAVAPWGDKRPADMTLADWTLTGNTAVKEWVGIGNPSVTGVLFYDGSVYADGTPLGTFCTRLESPTSAVIPQLLIRRQSYPPPPGQGVIPQMTVAVHAEFEVAEGDWQPARVGLWLPLHAEKYNRAFLHCYVGTSEEDAWTRDVDIFTEGFTLSEGPASGSLSQLELSELWIWEYLEVWTDADGAVFGESGVGREFQACHILIRTGSEPQNWWHYTSRNLRLKAGSIAVTVGGCQQWFTVNQVGYGWGTATCAPLSWPGMPAVYDGDANAWNDDPTWGAVSSTMAGWTVTVAEDAGAHRPIITATPSGPAYTRPVVWYATEDNPTLVGDADPQTEDTDSVAGGLLSLTYEVSDTYQGAQGTALIRHSEDDTERFPNWKPNSKMELHGGWQADAGAGLAVGKIAELYIKPDGLKRGRQGDEATAGAPYLEVSMGDYAEVRAARNECMDMRQAGGQTAEEWAQGIANYLGITDALCNVSAEVADMVIPLCPDIPSLPSCLAQDGHGILDHIREVQTAADLRVGFNRLIGGTWYLMFVDAGPPTYTDGVSPIAYTIDHDSTTEEDAIWVATADSSGDRFRNVVKSLYGRPGKPLIAADKTQQVYYWAETLASRKASVGDAWRMVMRDENATNPGDLMRTWARDYYSWQGALRWTGPLRRDIMPDDFVEVGTLPGIGIPANAVYQVVSVKQSYDFDRYDATMEILAKLVYPTQTTYYGMY